MLTNEHIHPSYNKLVSSLLNSCYTFIKLLKATGNKNGIF